MTRKDADRQFGLSGELPAIGPRAVAGGQKSNSPSAQLRGTALHAKRNKGETSVTILQLRDRLLPSVATILLAACSNNQQPTPDKSAAAEAVPVVSPSIAPSEVPPKTASTNAAPDEATLSASPSPSASASGASPVSTPLTSSPATQAPEKIAQAATPPATWTRCAVCHAAEKGAPAKLGPNLYGVYGHKMGQGSYAFSDALKASALTLDDATLDKWLENPRALVPGNRMSFPGLKDPAKRAEIIAYLKQQR